MCVPGIVCTDFVHALHDGGKGGLPGRPAGPSPRVRAALRERRALGAGGLRPYGERAGAGRERAPPPDADPGDVRRLAPPREPRKSPPADGRGSSSPRPCGTDARGSGRARADRPGRQRTSPHRVHRDGPRRAPSAGLSSATERLPPAVGPGPSSRRGVRGGPPREGRDRFRDPSEPAPVRSAWPPRASRPTVSG